MKSILFIIFILICLNLFPIYHKVAEITSDNIITAFDIKDNICYIASYGDSLGRIDFFEISNPEFPVFMISFEIDGRPKEVILKDNLALIFWNNFDNTNSFVDIYDISNPPFPEYLSQLQIQFAITNIIATSDDYIYRKAGDFFEVISISSPRNPEVITSFSNQTIIHDFTISEDKLFMATSGGVVVYDISDPYQMDQIWSHPNGSSRAPVVEGNMFYYTGYNNGFRAVEMHENGDFEILTEPNDLFYQNSVLIDNILYATTEKEMFLIDIADIHNPIVTSSYFYNRGHYNHKHYNIEITGDYAFLNLYNDYNYDEEGWIDIIDISDVDFGTNSDLIRLYSKKISASLSSNTLMSLETGDISFYDITNPIDPQYLYTDIHDTNFGFDDIYMDDYIACASAGWNLYVYNQNNHEELDVLSLTFLDHDIYSPHVTSINRVGYYLLVGMRHSGVQIIDISDLTDPNIICVVNDNYNIYDAYYDANILYFLDYYGLWIYDVSDMDNPIQLYQMPTNNDYQAFAFYDNYIYLTSNFGTMSIYDVSDPFLLQLESSVVLNYNSILDKPLHIQDDKLVILDNRWNELFVFDLTTPASPNLITAKRINSFANHYSITNDYIYMSHYDLYRHTALDISECFTDYNPHEINVPDQILHNYPNPFTPSSINGDRNLGTKICFDLAKEEHVKLEIYNIKGQLVRSLIDEQLQAGDQSIHWNGKDSNGQVLSSGIYFSRLSIGNNQDIIGKCLLLK